MDLLADRSLPRRWAASWAAEPRRPVLHAGHWINAAELEERTAERARTLIALGAGPGRLVLLCASTPITVVEWHIGALRSGSVVIPVNPAYRAREIAHIVGDAEPAVAVVESDEHAAWIEAAAPALTVVRTASPPDVAEDAPLDSAEAGDPALLPYTSGTTGAPKGALLSHGNLLASVTGLRSAWRWTPDDRLVHALPLFHMHGLGVGLYGTLAAGASAVLLTGFDAASVLDAAGAHDATLLFGVPTMYGRLVDAPGAGRLARLRMLASGSAPLAPDLFRRIEAVSGQRVVERYGMTETMMNTSNPYAGERRPGSVGLPLPGVEVRLSGATGEVELRGPNVFAGYWRSDAATAGAFTADGWFRTGDLGQLDADGYLRIAGRAKELIITGGYNVYPREVEDALLELPGVREVAVVGRPSDEWGETVAAFVVGDADEDASRAHCAERLASYKRPRRIVYVDVLPRNALGKVLRGELPD